MAPGVRVGGQQSDNLSVMGGTLARIGSLNLIAQGTCLNPLAVISLGGGGVGVGGGAGDHLDRPPWLTESKISTRN